MVGHANFHKDLLEQVSHTCRRFGRPREGAVRPVAGCTQVRLDIPVFVDGAWVGLVGFADQNIERTWTEEELRLLVAAASMVGAWEAQV